MPPLDHKHAIDLSNRLRGVEGFRPANDFIRQWASDAWNELDSRQKIDVFCTVAENNRILGADDSWSTHLRLLREGSRLEDHRLWTWSALGLGRIAFRAERLDISFRLFLDVARGSIHHHDRKNLAWALRGLADCVIHSRHHDEVLSSSLLREATRLFIAEEHVHGELWALQSWGDHWVRVGKPDQAQQCYRESFERFAGVDQRGHFHAGAMWSWVIKQGDRAGSGALKAALRVAAEAESYFASSGVSPPPSILSRIRVPNGKESKRQVDAHQ
jgi:hypothetical protein